MNKINELKLLYLRVHVFVLAYNRRTVGYSVDFYEHHAIRLHIPFVISKFRTIININMNAARNSENRKGLAPPDLEAEHFLNA
jgi:hypothetical protein